ncbi:MAG TPA: hypothetical protein DGD08_16860 [Gemmatimonas aurantiaca]|uniref:Peptidase M14 domain-containing protein n=2 Tax=Gemmatimonas aurantiaca TaxID=173480 RepID=C1A3L7_GEMAT|nr:M14 family zinc carboxypeptidase [Gemmatimonas aurantiaca]BAH37094.1 hypothetical protein GAU_0052 [Gemmatimonas aurantiaca T-27]HCT58873.1 hypothetical protein [Gemmatimonas aurantiaca]
MIRSTFASTLTARVAALLGLGASLALAPAAEAQHTFADPGATFDPAVPTPQAILGYELGSRFTTHRQMMRYIERIAATSKRVKVDTIGRSFEGREMLLLTISSEANLARVAEIKRDAQRIADPRGAGAGDIDAAIKRLPSIVWLAHSVHGGEASGVEAGLGLLYQLAAGTDANTRMSLDSTVVLIDPNQNPDGRERHTHDIERMWSPMGLASDASAMNNAGSWPGPRTSHYYFDLNRDWYAQSHPESRGRVREFLKWMPHVAVDLHEQGSSSSFYFAPPREPDNQNNPKHLPKWFDIFAAAHGAAFDVHGWSYFRREGYDSFYPGYGEGWPMLTGSVGMLFESASSAGGSVMRNDGTLRTLKQAAWEHFTAEWATVRTSASRRTELLRDYAAVRAGAITTHAKGPMRGMVFARDAEGRADSLAVKLLENGLEVQMVRGSTTLPSATSYFQGTTSAVTLKDGGYVVDFAQPMGHLAKALLEPDAALDSAFLKFELELRRTGQRNRFYDMTAWSLPLAWRVEAWTVPAMPAGLVAAEVPSMNIMGVPRSNYGYAFAPGSESSIRLLASLLSDSVRVWYAPNSFTSKGQKFPNGAFVIRVAFNRPEVHDIIVRRVAEARATIVPIPSAGVDEGTDLGSNSVIPVQRPKVALLGGAPVNGTSFGFSWYAMDQRLKYPSTIIDANFVGSGDLAQFTTIVVPSVQAAALDRALGDGGRDRLVNWVRNGGTLIALDAASAWLAQERVGLVRTRVRRDSARADSAGGAPLPSSLPGVMARASIDTLSPLMAGITNKEIPVFANSDRVFTVPRDLRAGEAIVRFAAAPRVRISGFYWPEMPARIAGSPYLWTERAGRGRVILFAHDPVYRDQLRGTLALFANAVLLGGSF